MLVIKEGELSKIDNRTLIDNLIVDQSFKTEKTNNIILMYHIKVILLDDRTKYEVKYKLKSKSIQIIKFVITFLPIVRNV